MDQSSRGTAKPLIEAEHLSVAYGGATILDHIDLAIRAGEIVTLIGPNGSGKTTLVRALLGLVQPTAGRVVRHTGRIGYVPQGFMRDRSLPLTAARFVMGFDGASKAQAADVLAHTKKQMHTCALPYYLLSRNLFSCTNEADLSPTHSGDHSPLSPELESLVIPRILGNTRQNGKELEAVAPKLASLGLPLRAWLLERNEHLYNCAGFETYEPIFDKKYLKRVAGAMHDLWCGTVDLQPVSYEYLAAELREPHLQRVKTAVRRIAVIGRYRNSDADVDKDIDLTTRPSIRYTISGWSWLKGGLPLRAMCERIEFLEDPWSYLDIEPTDKPGNKEDQDTGISYIKLGSPLDQLFNAECKWPFSLPDAGVSAPEEPGKGARPGIKQPVASAAKEPGGLVQPDAQHPGTGNIVIVGKAGTGKSTLAMQIAAEAVKRNDLYAAYFSLEESRSHLFSKVHHFDWGGLLAPVNMPQEEAYSRDIPKLAADLSRTLEGHCCRMDVRHRGGDIEPCPDEVGCEFRLFCKHRIYRDTKGVVVLPKLLPFAFGDNTAADGSDQLFHDRFRQLESFLDAIVNLRSKPLNEDKDIRIVCVDSLNVLGRGGMTRDHLAALFDLFKRHKVIGVFVLEDAARGVFAGESELDQETIEFLSDVVVELTGGEEDGYLVRHFQIKKARYQQHVLGRHPFKIRAFPKEPGRENEERAVFEEEHGDKSLFGLRIFPSTHHVNAVLSNSKNDRDGAAHKLRQIWTDDRIDEKLLGVKPSGNKKRGAVDDIFTIIGPATSCKSALAKNYLLQGILETPCDEPGSGDSLIIHLAANCDKRNPAECFFTKPDTLLETLNRLDALRDKPVDNTRSKDKWVHPAVAQIEHALKPVDRSKYDWTVYGYAGGGGNSPVYISLALKSGFLLPEEFFEVILLLFEWAKNRGSGGKIRRVVLCDVSAIGHSYPLLRKSSTDCDLFLSNLVQFFRFKRTSFMMVASRTGVPECETIVEKAISLADYVIESNHLDVFGDRYITYTGPGAVKQELNRGDKNESEIESVPAVLREALLGDGSGASCYELDFDALAGLVGFSSGHIRRPGVSLYMFEEGALQQRYNTQIKKMLELALAAPEQKNASAGQQFYPDVEFVTFGSSESEAVHNGVDLLANHPLHRTVVRTIDEFAVAGHDCVKDAQERKKEEDRIYYKNVLVLLMRRGTLPTQPTWQELGASAAQPGGAQRCFYDRSARETLTAGILDAVSSREYDGIHTERNSDQLRESKNASRDFPAALQFFANGTAVREYDPHYNCDIRQMVEGRKDFVLLCWYTQARHFIKKAQEKEPGIGAELWILPLPNKGFRGDWYLQVDRDSVSPALGKQICERLLRNEEQMKRFFDGVALPAWHKFGRTNLYFEKYMAPRVQEIIAAALSLTTSYMTETSTVKDEKEILSRVKTLRDLCKDSVRSYFVEEAGLKMRGESVGQRTTPGEVKEFLIAAETKGVTCPPEHMASLLELGENTDRLLPAFRGSGQQVHDILRVHAEAKKRSEIGREYDASGTEIPTQNRLYKDIHAELYFLLRGLVERCKGGAVPEDIEVHMQSVIDLCNLKTR